jgi:dTDP-D-glucose 4,6-dehydratase
VVTGKDRAFNDEEYSINDDKLRSLGWSPKIDFWDAIRSICDERAYFRGR